MGEIKTSPIAFMCSEHHKEYTERRALNFSLKRKRQDTAIEAYFSDTLTPELIMDLPQCAKCDYTQPGIYKYRNSYHCEDHFLEKNGNSRKKLRKIKEQLAVEGYPVCAAVPSEASDVARMRLDAKTADQPSAPLTLSNVGQISPLMMVPSARKCNRIDGGGCNEIVSQKKGNTQFYCDRHYEEQKFNNRIASNTKNQLLEGKEFFTKTLRKSANGLRKASWREKHKGIANLSSEEAWARMTMTEDDLERKLVIDQHGRCAWCPIEIQTRAAARFRASLDRLTDIDNSSYGYDCSVLACLGCQEARSDSSIQETLAFMLHIGATTAEDVPSEMLHSNDPCYVDAWERGEQLDRDILHESPGSHMSIIGRGSDDQVRESKRKATSKCQKRIYSRMTGRDPSDDEDEADSDDDDVQPEIEPKNWTREPGSFGCWKCEKATTQFIICEYGCGKTVRFKCFCGAEMNGVCRGVHFRGQKNSKCPAFDGLDQMTKDRISPAPKNRTGYLMAMDMFAR